MDMSTRTSMGTLQCVDRQVDSLGLIAEQKERNKMLKKTMKLSTYTSTGRRWAVDGYYILLTLSPFANIEADSDRTVVFVVFAWASTETSTGLLWDVDGQTDGVQQESQGYIWKRSSAPSALSDRRIDRLRRRRIVQVTSMHGCEKFFHGSKLRAI